MTAGFRDALMAVIETSGQAIAALEVQAAGIERAIAAQRAMREALAKLLLVDDVGDERTSTTVT